MDARNERKVVDALARLLTNEALSLGRWRRCGRIFMAIGWALVCFTFFAYFSAATVSRNFLFVPLAGGVCIGLGIWFSYFVTQWPIVSAFIDRESVESRARELSV